MLIISCLMISKSCYPFGLSLTDPVPFGKSRHTFFAGFRFMNRSDKADRVEPPPQKRKFGSSLFNRNQHGFGIHLHLAQPIPDRPLPAKCGCIYETPAPPSTLTFPEKNRFSKPPPLLVVTIAFSSVGLSAAETDAEHITQTITAI